MMANLVWILALTIGAIAVTANDIKGVLPLPEGDDIKIEHLPDSIPALELTKSKPLEIPFKNAKDLEPETILQPIAPMFPSFFNPGQIFGMPQKIQDNDSQPKHGILTIILVKSKHPESMSPQISDDIAPDAAQFKQNLLNSAEDRFQSLTQFLLSDLFGVQAQQQPGNPIDQTERVHLLGGRGDPDHFQGFGFKDEQGSDFIRLMKDGEISDNMGMDLER
jgi:hypothetical protein